MINLGGESKSEKSCSFSAAQEPSPALDGSNINVEAGQASSIRVDPFGNPLLPLSTTDPLDPLNWPLSRKYTIITVVCFGYFMMIYAVTAPVPTFVDLQAQFDVSYTRINWTFAVANLGASVGPLFFSASGDIIGRRPILIFGTAISVIASGCTSIHDISIQGYSAARFFQAFGATPAITIGLSIINDLSWEYERGFRVGLWVMSLDMGAYIAPCLSSFVATKGQYWVEYHVTILFTVLFLLEVWLVPETLYPREAVLGLSEPDITFKRTTELPFINLSKIEGIYHPKPWATIAGFLKMFQHPVIVITVVTYSFSLYWWIISVVTMVPVAYSSYDLTSQGLMFLGLALGTLVAEVFCSGRLGDYIVGRLSAGRGRARTPEMRLWLAYLGVIMFAAGLVLWGFAIENKYHFMVGQLGFFLVGIGLQMTNTAIAAYVVDNCPVSAMDVITFYSVWLNLSSFANSWFISDWVAAQGFSFTFGIQAMIAVVIMIPVLALLQIFGQRLRTLSPVMMSATASGY